MGADDRPIDLVDLPKGFLSWGRCLLVTVVVVV